MTNIVVIGIDCGLKGGISILINNKSPLIYRIPLKKIIVNKKNKNTYDMVEIINIFKKYKNKKVLFVIERQQVRRGEGSVSAMTIGKNYGQLLGVAYALEFKVIEVTPQSWKKCFTELITAEMTDIKVRMKELRLIGKKLKGKEEKNENKKQVDKMGRKFKSLAKTEARTLVSKLYPAQSDKFVRVDSDGMAESVLISLYGKAQNLDYRR